MTEFKGVFIDVGQGDCTLLVLPDGRFMLVDVYRCPGQGTVDVFKVLRDLLPGGEDGRQLLHYLVITHAHDDHIWGIGDLAEEFEIGELWVPQYGAKQKLSDNYEAFEKVVEEQPDDRKVWQKGSRTPAAELGAQGEVSVRCFSPPGYIEVEEALDEDEARKVVHEHCGVYRVTFQGVSVMLAGDSNLAAWQRIVGYYEGRTDGNDLSVLASQVLHGSHHGSRTFLKDDKDDEPWLDALEAIDPADVVLSVGEGNRHEHPHPDMLAIYEKQVGAEHVHQTKDAGTVVLSVTGEGAYELAEDTTFAERYGWDDDDDDKQAGASGPPGSGSAGRTRRPPATPAPGHEKTPQRPPRRERYADA
jgi:competence protein ComEC